MADAYDDLALHALIHTSLQVAIITGSGQGLGAAAARLFAHHGAKLVVTDLDGSKAKQVSRSRKQGAALCQLDSSAPYMLAFEGLTSLSGR